LELTRSAKAVSRAFDAALAAAGGSLPTWLVLVSVKADGHGAQREIAKAIGVEGPTLTHHLNRMERDGLVVRNRDPGNRRVHRVTLTPDGEALFQRLLAAAIAFDAQLRRGFTADETTVLRELFGRLRTNIAEPIVVTERDG
jgi:MarR family transcriptional regulator for hemolysin